MSDTIILAIESSCDETACSIVKNGNEVLSNIVNSQIDFHKQYGGVIPESASRMHVENISKVIDAAINNADISYDDLDAIAYTQGPGLIGSLHIGVVAAKTLAWTLNLPIIPVNHIYGHIMANQIDSEKLLYPLLALVVSGGHSELIYFKNENTYEILGKTTDDAVGEAFDKVGRIMDIPYPGGVEIDKLSKFGKPIYELTEPKAEGEYNFSFSGLKSSVLQLVARENKAGRKVDNADLASSFQNVAINQLIRVSEDLIGKLEIKQFVLAGGVAANSRLRSEITRLSQTYSDIKFSFPQMKYCADNAAMIGAAAYPLFLANKFGTLKDGANPSHKKLMWLIKDSQSRISVLL